nr:MAG TPA: hypothetical protein [Crassvirales sp.]
MLFCLVSTKLYIVCCHNKIKLLFKAVLFV